LPHDRQEYLQEMGHVWLGFSEPQLSRLFSRAGLVPAGFRTLPADPTARGPSLFAAAATFSPSPAIVSTSSATRNLERSGT